MEHIYFATSPQFQGLVKIGRTDRDPSERMGELAGYGLEGFEGESTWSAAKQHILIVDDNSTAEATLHQFFSDLRVQEGRELFEVTDLDAMVAEAQRLTGGRLLSEIADEKLAETVDGAARQRFPCGGRRLAISAGPQFPPGHKNFQGVINVFFADGIDGNWAELINPELNAAQ